MTRRSSQFKKANEDSPVVYASFDNGAVYRLADGKIFRLNHTDVRDAGVPRLALPC